MNPKTKIKKPKITEIMPVVIHQLKTPISVIKGYIEAISSGDCGKITPAQKEYLQDALENLKRMSLFIDSLLDVSKVEDKKLDVKLEPVDLDKIIAEVLKNLAPWIEANNCEVFFEKPLKLPKVLTNRIRIREAIQNFISNAAIYKERKGKVRIALRREGKKVLFKCQDNGIGIPKKDFKKVFTKFYRSEKAMTLDPSGTGLGLFICKAIIELSGGKIWFDSKERKGTTFYFTLPIVK